MVKGAQLSLKIGAVGLTEAPREAMEALTSVRVTVSADAASGFQLSFALPPRSQLHEFFGQAGSFGNPMLRIAIGVTVNGVSDVLMDGIVTNTETAPSSASEPATLVLTGTDLTRVMDYIDFSGLTYPAMAREARVAIIVAKYAIFGMLPMVIPSVMIDVPLPTERIPTHQGKDLQYVKQLAEEVGHVFYLEPGPVMGMSVAYWGPEIKQGVPQPALNADMDGHRNVESLSFSFDSDSAVLPMVMIQEERSGSPLPIPIPSLSPINPPLAAIPPVPKNIEWMDNVANVGPIRAFLLGVAKAARKSETVTASGSLDVVRYGQILKARRLVTVRGAGKTHNGLYYVRSVTHEIQPGQYRQSFTLSRNAVLSTVSKVSE